MIGKQSAGTVQVAFWGAVLIGGANFVVVSVSNQELPPLFGAALRFSSACVLFFALARLRREAIPRGANAGWAALYGALGVGLFYGLVYYALVGLTAGTAAVILACMPLITMAVAASVGQERLSARAVAGGALAVAGIAVLSVDAGSALGGGRYLLAALLGAVASASSNVVARHVRDMPLLTMNWVGAAAGTVLLVVGSRLLGEPWTLPSGVQTQLALVWLVLAGTVGLFQLWLFVIREWGASVTTFSLAPMTIVASVLGALFLDQPVTAGFAVGAAMVLGAVYLGAGRR